MARASAGGHPRFATTRWSLVLAAGAREVPEARDALAKLCEHYWQPIYAFLRQRGYGHEESRDLTQAFLLDLLERSALRAADPGRGRFRSFLLGCLKHFLAHERERQQALKRGGGRQAFALPAEEGDSPFHPVSREDDPEAVFEQVWMKTVLHRVLECLAATFPEKDREYLRRLLPALYDVGSVDSPAVAREFGKTAEAVRQATSRLRRRYREFLLEEIAQTVSDPAEVDDEIRHLFQVAAR